MELRSVRGKLRPARGVILHFAGRVECKVTGPGMDRVALADLFSDPRYEVLLVVVRAALREVHHAVGNLEGRQFVVLALGDIGRFATSLDCIRELDVFGITRAHVGQLGAHPLWVGRHLVPVRAATVLPMASDLMG